MSPYLCLIAFAVVATPVVVYLAHLADVRARALRQDEWGDR